MEYSNNATETYLAVVHHVVHHYDLAVFVQMAVHRCRRRHQIRHLERSVHQKGQVRQAVKAQNYWSDILHHPRHLHFPRSRSLRHYLHHLSGKCHFLYQYYCRYGRYCH